MVRNLTVALAPDDFKAADELGPQVRLCLNPCIPKGAMCNLARCSCALEGLMGLVRALRIQETHTQSMGNAHIVRECLTSLHAL